MTDDERVRHALYPLFNDGLIPSYDDVSVGHLAELAAKELAALRACAEARATDGKYFFPLTGKPPCPDCGQPEGVQLHLGATGYSVGGGFQHTPECKANFCPHGIAWSEDCGRCDMARIEEGE